MIRERRTREKLQQYYRKFREEGWMDPNVHPWVAEAWEKSKTNGVPTKTWNPSNRLSEAELDERLVLAKPFLRHVDGLYDCQREFFSQHNISMLILDHESYVLKSFSMTYFQKTPGEIVGYRLAEKDIGASSIGIALNHKTTFVLYGPEIWLEDGQSVDAATAPILRDGEIRYLVTLIMMDGADKDGVSMDAVVSLLLSMKQSLEQALLLEETLATRDEILDRIPLVVYQVAPDGEVVYANRPGAERIVRGRKPNFGKGLFPSLKDTVLNYRHTQIPKAFLGVPSHNRELVWIIGNKTYEDIADIWPVYREGKVNGAVVVSAPIEEMKTLLAYASQYKARYSLSSLAGASPKFLAMKDKAARCAKHASHLLIVGEPGTGKQRLAHGIHQAGANAAGPLITIRCGDVPPELLPRELFGHQGSKEDLPGKIELARGGTLFIDEFDKISESLGIELAAALKKEKEVRIIAAADVDPRKLVSKGIFSEEIYVLVAQSLIRTPSLRHRQSDIPLIAQDILQELVEQNPADSKRLSAGAVELLVGYDWPGNIKQLQGVIEQAFFKTQGMVIHPSDLVLPGLSGWGKSWKRERGVFMEAWKSCGGNISRLAANLGVSRVTLYRYLEKYGLERNRK